MDWKTTASFDKAAWSKIKTDSDAWWRGELERPLIQVRIHNAPTSMKKPDLPWHGFQSFYDLNIPATRILDAYEYELSTTRYAGDAFPHLFVNFGPGVIAAFLGCKLVNGNGTVWFHPEKPSSISELELKESLPNTWFERIRQIKAEAVKRWQGAVQVGMTDLGGNLDILASFRPNEGLLLDLYDNPEKVKELTFAAHGLWWEFFESFNDVLQPVNPGYTSWCPIFSSEPFYILQSDFCYMIGPEMFDEFVKPELAASCRRLTNAFYHLDGKGQLGHLDSLLSIPELKGVQWVPGTGAPRQSDWPEVYRKIHDAGKLIQMYCFDSWDELDRIADAIGTARGILLIADADYSQIDEAEKFLAKWL